MKDKDEFEFIFGEDPGGFGTDKAIYFLVGCGLALFGLFILAMCVIGYF